VSKDTGMKAKRNTSTPLFDIKNRTSTYLDKITYIVYNVIKKDASMTKNEITEVFDIPLSTLYDWEKEGHSKNKLYKLLSHLNKKVAQSTIDKPEETHRIFHILNKNIAKEYKYTKEEIQKAFSKKASSLATQREKIIYSRFFKECDVEDLLSLEKTFQVSKRDIKRIYKDLPERAFPGVAKVWDKRFRMPPRVNDTSHNPISNKAHAADFTQIFLAKSLSHV